MYEQAPVSAGRGIRYDTTQPETWTIPLFNHIRPVPQAVQTLPEGGYLVPSGWAAMVTPYLRQHGVQHQVIARRLFQIRVESMRVQDDDVIFEPRPFQGRTRTQVNGRWVADTVTLPPGSLFIPMDQPHAWMVAQLLEPSAPDSLSSWGLFNTAYELSDLIAGHRELELARWMVAQHPTIRSLFGEAAARPRLQPLPDFSHSIDTALTQQTRRCTIAPGGVTCGPTQVWVWGWRYPLPSPVTQLTPPMQQGRQAGHRSRASTATRASRQVIS
ncbi:MAG: hypothetical protein EBV79_08735 [Betaproteobacteria bacterium]|nr:hypothetical protein [Betaproteobacteria bacterium]